VERAVGAGASRKGLTKISRFGMEVAINHSWVVWHHSLFPDLRACLVAIFFMGSVPAHGRGLELDDI